ncbi:MAG: NAD-dependent epimerase/dehydratase family protein, partial [Anaerolineae bacterium]|nr:NAD-dependent epimerase/dehydratase family protein [Anaerolineae bacterium]MDW8071660.1 NAD-dependent epimerase/dehydratase family protein [Anaerolineae bacterium]
MIGATGFIGGAIARAAVEHGWQVRGTRRAAQHQGAIADLAAQGQLTWCYADLNDPDSLVEAMTGCQVVFHAAGYYPRSSRHATAQIALAHTQMENVLQAFRRAKPDLLIYTSSLSTIGRPNEPGRLADERDVYRLNHLPICYFNVKITMETLALSSGLPVVVLCPTAVFGPGDVKPTSGKLFLMAARGWLFFYPDGVQDVVDVRDVAASHVRAVARGQVGQRYILGGETMTYRQMLTVIARVAGQRPPWLRVPSSVVALLGRWAAWWGILGGDL